MRRSTDSLPRLVEQAFATLTGQDLWRRLGELLRSGAAGADGPGNGDVTRRELLKLFGASIALAGVGACARQPAERILPYTVQPTDITPGNAVHYATAMEIDGYATGLVVEAHEGRPTKIEGNAHHPASLGAAGVLEQASILTLYDPARARGMRRHKGAATWDTFVRQLGERRGDGGAGLRIIMDPTGSPLLGALLERVARRQPGARVTFHCPARPRNAAAGLANALGRPAAMQYDISKADVLLALDSDFLASGPMHLRHARAFADGRRVTRPGEAMNRLYAVEASVTPTGTAADHRIVRRSSEIARFAAAIAAELAESGRSLAMRPPPPVLDALRGARAAEDNKRIAAIARDLARAGSRALVLVGDRQPADVHAIGVLIGAMLGSAGSWPTEPVLLDDAPFVQDLDGLAAELRAGAVDTLIVLGANPAYSAPADFDLAGLIRRVQKTACLGLYEHETAEACDWFVHAAHYLESWGDARAYDGTLSLVQPLIQPLFGGRTSAEVLAVLAGDPLPDAHRLLREQWASRDRDRRDPRALDDGWAAALQRGVVPGSEAPRLAVAPSWEAIASAIRAILSRPPADPAAVEVDFAPDPSVHDGRFTNNAWLLELPNPLTKLTWDNAALLAPGTAAKLGVENEQRITIELRGRTITAPVLTMPGLAENTVTLHLGYGRSGAEALARDVGFNAYALRPSDAPAFASGARLQRAPGRHRLAVTQSHWRLEGGAIARATTAAIYAERADTAGDPKTPLPSLLGPSPSHVAADAGDRDQWAMSIDLTACTGCNACVVACQSENNTPIVGKNNVLNSREMHWLRIDTYVAGPPETPAFIHQPMLCQHCERAPCEYVCPVNATVHSPDGLNEMVYNRCIGTRFCSNNCPYKVRRFNWFDWGDYASINGGLTMLQRNPDVTVRERGVMEKCTYCVQRIRRTEIRAAQQRRPIRDGEVQTACQQACAARAIVFGSLANHDAEVALLRRQPRSYSALRELGAEPRTRYLTRIANPNPELEEERG